MKRIVLLTILSVYVLLTAGVQLHLHYCCGHLSDFHFQATNDCEHGNDEEHEGDCCGKQHCCSFIHIDLKVDESHQPSELARFIPILFLEPNVPLPAMDVCANSNIIDFSENDSPPPNSKRYLLFHSLVLYA